MIETDVAHQLRNAADKMHIAPLAQSELILMLRLAADEADRFYNGMMAWKQTAQTKDAKLSQEMTDRVNERIAARLAADPPRDLTQEEVEDAAKACHALDMGDSWSIGPDMLAEFAAIVRAIK